MALTDLSVIMSESSGLYSGARRKRRPKERFPVREREFVRDPVLGKSEFRRNARDLMPMDSNAKLAPMVQMNLKQPIILAKPESNDVLKQRSTTNQSINTDLKKFNLKPRSVNASNSSHSPQTPQRSFSQFSEITAKAEFTKGGSVPTFRQTMSQTASSRSEPASVAKDKFESSKSVKLLDNLLHWFDGGIEFLEDQANFLVVGILGKQGVGKSTIMSYLAGSDVKADHKKLIFPTQTQDIMERASNMTVGVDMFVTAERMIFLDAQPILSPSLLEQCIYNDRKMSAEYNGPSVGIEMQSLQIATFFLSVCHVVILVQDWFTDSNLYRFLQSAEMLKLSTPAPNPDLSNTEKEFDDVYPHIIFVQNKASDTLFDPSNLVAMTKTISNLMQHSKLLYKGSISLSKSMLFPHFNWIMPPSAEINLFLIPKFQCEDDEDIDNCLLEDTHFQSLPQFVPHPKEEYMLKIFRNMIFSIRRLQLTRQILTEKTWFYYAAKTWDAIKKSQLMSEYNRLLV